MKRNLLITALFLIICVPGFLRADELELIDSNSEQIMAAVNASSADVVLVNFWATWCIPCRDEFPAMMKTYNHYTRDQMDLILVSTDFKRGRDQAIDFLKEQGVDFKTYRKDEVDQPFIEAFSSEWNGALPATVIYDKSRQPVEFWIGEADYDKFKSNIQKHLTNSINSED